MFIGQWYQKLYLYKYKKGSVCCYSRVSLISGTAIATQVDFILIGP